MKENIFKATNQRILINLAHRQHLPMLPYLSKSDFKVAQTCATKLYYKKNKYPSLKDENEYLALLADGGFMIGKLALVLYPEGIEIGEGRGNQKEAIEQTERLLSAHENITLFEPAIWVNNQLIRIDILEKKGNHFNLIEVKSKSYNSEDLAESRGKHDKIPYWMKADFRPYLEDVAFQKKVLQEKYPQATVSAYLLMPDKSKTNTHENLIHWFRLNKSGDNTLVEFTGTEENAAQLRDSNFMGLECVDTEIERIKEEIQSASKRYIDSLAASEKIITQVSYACRDCEYRVDQQKSGFKECWGKLAEPRPHILELGQLGNVNKKDNTINDLISRGKTSLSDVPVEAVLRESKPFYNDRPFFQLVCKEEFILEGFEEAIANIQYPLHFIDFETCQMAVPFHAGMRPFQNVIFQWSCHTFHEDGRLEHKEWLNTQDVYPNFEFATTLKACLGQTGTVMTWSAYENTQLKSILLTIEESEEFDEALRNWLANIIVEKNSENNRILDMHKLAGQYYFHPLMGGRTSIKVVLPSVLKSTNSASIKQWLKEENLLAETEHGMTDPYKLLEDRIIGDTRDQIVTVKNGGDAMAAYRDMMYGISKDNLIAKQAYNEALKQYCKLDTLAMVIIWQHWQNLIKSGNRVTSRENIITNLNN
jgi:hypothetical protein